MLANARNTFLLVASLAADARCARLVPSGQSLNAALRPGAPLVACPGGGILFWWQAGAVKGLRTQCPLDEANFVGASAGSLAAVLTASGVDMDDAFDHAITLSKRANLWERPLGLAGIWGELVRQWLNDLLPSDAAQRTSGRVAIVVLRTLPFPRRMRFSQFESKADLVDCALASCHIPYFLDGRFSARFRSQRWIDGSFLASRRTQYRLEGAEPAMLFIDPAADPTAPRDFLRLRSPEGVRAMMDSGLAYSASPPMRAQAAQLAHALARKSPPDVVNGRELGLEGGPGPEREWLSS